MKFDKINEIIDLIISNEYTKIYKTYHPMKNYDLAQDRILFTTKSLIYLQRKIVILSLNIFLSLNI